VKLKISTGAHLFFVVVASSFLTYCGKTSWQGETVEIETGSSSQKVQLPPNNESDPSLNPDFQSLNAASTSFIDVRGVGDAAWSDTHVANPPSSGFANALKAFDPQGIKLKGDFSFINMETTFGGSCSKFWTQFVPGQAYAFTSHPNTIRDAFRHGFNLFGLSNNHSRDCHNSSGDGQDGIRNTVKSFETMKQNLGNPKFLWHGVAQQESDKLKPAVEEFQVKGRKLKVAFASLYTGRQTCPLSVCNSDTKAILQNLASAQADLRILSIHSQGSASQDGLVRTGIDFIQKYNGDIVFGHGPHVWEPVRVVAKPNGKKGVVFESLGNFLHPGLAAQSNNFLGRVLLDSKTLEPIQIQVLPIRNQGESIVNSPSNARNAGANLTWKAGSGAAGILYTNIKHGLLSAGK
jgi:hypothetical protein